MKATAKRGAMILLVGLAGVSAVYGMKGLLEKKLYYLHQGAIESISYWAIYFGDYELTLSRKFPGEEEKPIDVSVNFSFLSTGFIEGRGYSDKGKIDCSAEFMIRTSAGDSIIQNDDIAYVYDYGRKVCLKDGAVGEFFLNVEETVSVQPKKMILRRYKFYEQYGQKMLGEDRERTDLPLGGFSFTKEGITQAKKMMESR